MQAIDNTGERMLSVAMEEGVITPEEYGLLGREIGYWPHPAAARTALLDLLSEREARERRGALVVVSGGHLNKMLNHADQEGKHFVSTETSEPGKPSHLVVTLAGDRVRGHTYLWLGRLSAPEFAAALELLSQARLPGARALLMEFTAASTTDTSVE